MAEQSTREDGIRECPKCGALIPDEEEVLCQNCGTAFGVKTTVIKAVVVPDQDTGPRKKRRKAPPAAGLKPAPGTSSPLVLLIVVGLVVLIAALALMLLVLN